MESYGRYFLKWYLMLRITIEVMMVCHQIGSPYR